MEAVLRELVSAPISLLTGNLQGILRKWACQPARERRIPKQTRAFPAKFPGLRNREFFKDEQGKEPQEQGKAARFQGSAGMPLAGLAGTAASGINDHKITDLAALLPWRWAAAREGRKLAA